MDKTKQWGLATAAAILAVVVGGWFLLISPQRSTASDLQSQRDAQEQSNQTLQQRIEALKAQHKDLPSVQAALAKLADQLPSNPSMPALIRQLSTDADEAGVQLISISPTEPKFVEATAIAAPPSGNSAGTSADAVAEPVRAPAASLSSNRLAYVPITVLVNGSYVEVEEFLNNLEHNKRAFLTSSLDAIPAPPKKAGDSEGTTDEYHGHLETTITGQVFINVPPATQSTTTTNAK